MLSLILALHRHGEARRKIVKKKTKLPIGRKKKGDCPFVIRRFTIMPFTILKTVPLFPSEFISISLPPFLFLKKSFGQNDSHEESARAHHRVRWYVPLRELCPVKRKKLISFFLSFHRVTCITANGKSGSPFTALASHRPRNISLSLSSALYNLFFFLLRL